ncbi:hypothetical protein AV521_44140 [Streptomyces sp. IMTB 2501]|uniref:hypothetical protein n=1 Tax=Streptomyces sp. IMTB 2501 TaxID=1776340 RepID=UPI00096D1800|nr:hypothetical protein [Streptomyces sp. IMTB 2501]OLZ61207.1 hypothetical protein AV521_44140 [Streptomyces sp. IMTB 2501]
MIEVLLLHWRMPAPAVEQGMAAAIRAGAITADVVAVEARRAAAAAPSPPEDLDDEGSGRNFVTVVIAAAGYGHRPAVLDWRLDPVVRVSAAR